MTSSTLESILDSLAAAGRADLGDTLLEVLDKAGILPPLEAEGATMETTSRTITKVEIVENGESFIPDEADENGDRDGTQAFENYRTILYRVLHDANPSVDISIVLGDWGTTSVTFSDGDWEYSGSGNYSPEIDAIRDLRERVFSGQFGEW